MANDVITAGTAVTPADGTPLPGGKALGLYIGGTGAVAVVHGVGTAPVTYAGVPAGAMLSMEVTQVLATGTTATNIVALR